MFRFNFFIFFKYKWLSFVVGCLFTLILTAEIASAVGSVNIKSYDSSAATGTVSRQTVSCDLSGVATPVLKSGEYDIINISVGDYHLYAENPGEPLLPSKLVYVAVEPGTEPGDITIKRLKSRKIEGVSVYPRQYDTPLSWKNVQPFIPLNSKIAESNQLFPANPVEFVESATVRGITMFVFRLWPVQVTGKSKSVLVNDSFEWTFSEMPGSKNVQTYSKRSGLFEKKLRRKVLNSDSLETVSLLSVDDAKSVKDSSECDYLIITSEALSEKFETFASYKNTLGLSSGVVTTETIYEDYTGTDNQAKIRNCIIDYATNKGTVWVLLGGDDTIVPDRNCYASVATSDGTVSDSTIPADIYYAGLDDDDWNDDDDSYWCEAKDFRDGDSVDLYPDVFVGRAPVQSETDADVFISKTIAYSDKGARSGFTDKALFCGLELWNTWEGKSDAHWRSENMWTNYIEDNWDGGTHDMFYDTGTDFDGGADYDVTAANLTDKINAGYGFVFVATHGNQTIWAMEVANNNFRSTNALSCTNENQQGIIYTMACITNAFDSEGGYGSDPCLSEAFIRNSGGGAVGYIGSSRYGWGYSSTSVTPMGPSMTYAANFFQEMFDESSLNSGSDDDPDPTDYPRRLGAVHASHKMELAAYATSDGSYRWLQFSLNLMGDPHLEIYDTVTGSLSVTITSSAEDAVSEGALWRLSGEEIWQESGTTLTDLALGDYTIEFNTISGWTSPDSVAVTVSEGATKTVSAEYVLLAGEVTVTIEPDDAITDGALWRLADEDWNDSGITLENVREGDYTIEFSDHEGWYRPDDISISVSAGDSIEETGLYSVKNVAPELSAIGNMEVETGELLSFTAEASDINTGTLVFAVSGLPLGAVFDTASGEFNWTPSSDMEGNYEVTIVASDDGKPPLSDSETFMISAGGVNRPPVLDSIGSQSVDTGETLSFSLTASDPDTDDTLTLGAVSLPDGALFDTDTGEFEWTPEDDSEGNYYILFMVTDNGTPRLQDSEQVIITVGEVNSPPVLGQIGNRSVAEGAQISFTVTATDYDEDTLSFSAVNIPSGAGFSKEIQVFDWTPGSGSAENYEMTFSVTDDGNPNLADSETIIISVGDVNRPPVLGYIGDRAADEDETISFVASATDPDGDQLTFSIQDQPDGASFDDTLRQFEWTPGFDDAGSYDISVVVTDDGTPAGSDSETITITVGNVNQPPSINEISAVSGVANQTCSFSLTATDPDGDSIVYSSSNLPEGATLDSESGLFKWIPGDEAVGVCTVEFTATDTGTPAMSDTLAVNISIGAVEDEDSSVAASGGGGGCFIGNLQY